jgi:nicotinamide riboside transporter PnuC
MLLGREPALIAAAIKGLIAFLCLTIFTGVSDDAQTAINALVAVLLGALVAFQVAKEKALPFVVGIVEAGVYVAVAFGVDISPEVQATLLVAVGSIVALVTRDRVTAKVPAQ